MASSFVASPSGNGGGGGARRPSSFLALIQGRSRKRPRPNGEQQDVGELPVAPSPPVPGFEWVHVRETQGRLHLYRHAPRTHHHPHRIGGHGGREGAGGEGAGGGGAPRWRSRSQVGSSLSLNGSSREGGGGGGGGGAGLPAGEGDALYYTLFRPARLSTVLLLGCVAPEGTSTRPLSAQQILEGLSLIAPRIAFLLIIREAHRHGSSTHVLVTLDSIEATEGWVDMLKGRDLSLGGQLVYISGVVMVDELESDALLSCMKSLVDDVGAGGGNEGGRGSPKELAQLGTVQVQGLGGRRGEGESAYCLAFGPPTDALALLSSLVLLEETEEKEESKKATDQEEGDEGKEGEEELLSLLSQGLDSYLAELPTCLQCLDRLDPVAIGTAYGPPPLPVSASYFPPPMPGVGGGGGGGGGGGAEGGGRGGLGDDSTTSDPSASPRPLSVCPTCRKVHVYALSQKRKRPRAPASASSSSLSSSSSSLPLTCNTCSIPENLWICLVCGHVGCGRYTAEHAKQHFHQAGHIFSLELATGRVWDYLEDAFVHSMQSQGGGGPLHMEGDADDDAEGEGGGGGGDDKRRQGKVDGLGAEYSALLMSQLEEQNMYYERLLAKTAAELVQSSCQDDHLSEQERKEAAQARAHIAKYVRSLSRTSTPRARPPTHPPTPLRLDEEYTQLMTALREAEEKARQMRGRNQGLLSEQKRETERLKSVRASVQQAKASLVDEVADLEAQISDLSFFLRTKEAVQESELEGGGVVIQQSSSTQDERGGGRRRRGGGERSR